MRNTTLTISVLADAGIPMIVFTFPAMVLLLIPVVATEAFLCKKWLGLSTWTALKANAASNLASTLLGIPGAWAIMLAVEFGTMGLVERIPKLQNWDTPLSNTIFLILDSAWLGPIRGDSIWIVPAATLVLLVPFFFASYSIEYLVLKFMVGESDEQRRNFTDHRLRIAVRNANLVTYGAMFVGTVIWLLVVALRYPCDRARLIHNLIQRLYYVKYRRRTILADAYVIRLRTLAFNLAARLANHNRTTSLR